ncbi:MAG: YopX family protein [Methylococcales bacterium]
MREIKFNYIYGIKDKPETYFNKTFSLADISNGLHWDEIADSPLLRDYKIIAYRQFTGIQDKNGKDIYEGDIVDDIFNVGQLKEIYYSEENACFMNRGIGSICGFDMEISIDPETLTKGKIIGNIHQNPELLEAEK